MSATFESGMSDDLARLLAPLVDYLVERVATKVLGQVVEPPQSEARGEWMSPVEAAEYLNCARQRIYDLRSSGRLSQTKEGGRAVNSREELDGLLEVVREGHGCRSVAPTQQQRISTQSAS